MCPGGWASGPPVLAGAHSSALPCGPAVADHCLFALQQLPLPACLYSAALCPAALPWQTTASLPSNSCPCPHVCTQQRSALWPRRGRPLPACLPTAAPARISSQQHCVRWLHRGGHCRLASRLLASACRCSQQRSALRSRGGRPLPPDRGPPPAAEGAGAAPEQQPEGCSAAGPVGLGAVA